jgi:hypothetical protein
MQRPGILEHHLHQLVEGAVALRFLRPAGDSDRAAPVAQQAAEDPQDRRFAGAGFADKAVGFPFRHMEIDAAHRMDGGHAAAEHHPEIADVDHATGSALQAGSLRSTGRSPAGLSMRGRESSRPRVMRHYEISGRFDDAAGYMMSMIAKDATRLRSWLKISPCRGIGQIVDDRRFCICTVIEGGGWLVGDQRSDGSTLAIIARCPIRPRVRVDRRHSPFGSRIHRQHSRLRSAPAPWKPLLAIGLGDPQRWSSRD